MSSVEKREIRARGLQAAFASLVIFGGVACQEESQSINNKETPPEITRPSSTPTLTPTVTPTAELEQIIDINDPVIKLCKALPIEAPKGSSGEFNWPTYGPIYGYFSKYHPGIDISPPFGSPVYAADGGVVVLKAEENWGYGNYIIVSHGPYLTLYAHLSKILVNLGDEIPKEEFVGEVGSTGYSIAPHLHFEIIKKERDFCQRINPLSLLP